MSLSRDFTSPLTFRPLWVWVRPPNLKAWLRDRFLSRWSEYLGTRAVSAYPMPVWKLSLILHVNFSACHSRCSSETNLQIPLPRTSIGQNAYCYRGAKLWNELSREAKLVPLWKTFKKSIIMVFRYFNVSFYNWYLLLNFLLLFFRS